MIAAAKRPVREANQWRGSGGTGRFPRSAPYEQSSAPSSARIAPSNASDAVGVLDRRAMEPLVASEDDLARLRETYGAHPVTELRDAMVANDFEPDDLFVDDRGRLCIVDREPSVPLGPVTADELERLFDYHELPGSDLAALRRRMVLEGSWLPDQLAIRAGTLFVQAEPDQ